MTRALSLAALAASLLALTLGGAVTAAELKVVSDRKLTGFPFPETIGCNAETKELYVGEFVSALKPAAKDGEGRIKRISLSGEVIEERFLPAEAGSLNKPKGIWVAGNRLWVADIDVVRIYDLESKKSRTLELPGAELANDTAVIGETLYVSDNRGDKLYKIEPADFLEASEAPRPRLVFFGKHINPNGIYPSQEDVLLMGGFLSAEEPRALFAVTERGRVKALSKSLGRLDGVYQLEDGSVLATEWNGGALIHWSADGGVETLAEGFKGPADFCVLEEGSKLTVAVPDLVQSEVRLIELQQ